MTKDRYLFQINYLILFIGDYVHIFAVMTCVVIFLIANNLVHLYLEIKI